jgi:hypothetical protein
MSHHEDHEDGRAVDSPPDSRAAEEAEEGRPHEDAPNPTQERIDGDPEADKPTDAPWST